MRTFLLRLFFEESIIDLIVKNKWRKIMQNQLVKVRRSLDQIEHLANELAEKYDVTHLGGPQGEVLYYLFKNRQRIIYINDIEGVMGTSKSVASNLIRRMVRNQFIKVEPAKNDLRRKQVTLTAYGESKIPKLKAFYCELNQILFADVTDADKENMLRMMQQLVINMNTYDKGGHK